MPRVKRSVAARKKRRKVLEQAKGYWGLKNSHYTYAKEQVEHSLTYAYRDRKNKKRTFRRLWIVRINAAAQAARPVVQPVHLRACTRPGSSSTASRSPTSRSPTRRRSPRSPSRRRPRSRPRQPEPGRASGGRLPPTGGALHAARLAGLRPAGRAARRGSAPCARDPRRRRLLGYRAPPLRRRAPPRAHRGRPGTRSRANGTTSPPRSTRTRDSLGRFVREQGVQTNETQRCVALVPAFLTARARDRPAARPRRARPERRPEPRLRPLPLPLRAGDVRRSRSPSRVRCRRARAGAGDAARRRRSRSGAGAGSTSRRSTSRVDDDVAAPQQLPLARPRRARRAARRRDRGVSRPPRTGPS